MLPEKYGTFYRNIFSATLRNKVKSVAMILKATHAQESKETASEKDAQVTPKLREKKLSKAAQKVEESIEETCT